VPNGPAFASDGVFFHCATDQGRIDLHHPDGVGWASETFMQLSKEDGLPDGILLDDEGSLWCGLWGGGGLLIMDPSTKSTQKLHVPATYITSMSPIGTDNHTLLITSAAGPVLRGERGGAPLEGRVFQAKLTRPWRVQSLRFGTPDL
jgi:sugar lactone lactonase YvrE